MVPSGRSRQALTSSGDALQIGCVRALQMERAAGQGEEKLDLALPEAAF